METQLQKSYFQSSFTIVEREKLYVKDFWLQEEPCQWTVTNYLSALLKSDPLVNRRTAGSRLLNDAKIIKGHVVAGTLAETMVTAVSKYNKNSRTKTSFKRYFDNLANYEEQKSRFRTSMAEQVAAEEEHSNARKRCSTRNKEDNPKRQKLNNNSNEDYKGIRNIWEEWRDFLTNEGNTCHLMQLSPEKHGVIWCGKLVRRRSCLPVTLFEKLNEEVVYVKATNISLYFLSQANEIVDTSSREAMGDEIEVLQRMVPEERLLIPEKKFLCSIFELFESSIYDDCGKEVLQKSEGCFRSYLFDDCLKITTQLLRRRGRNVTFLPGEIELNAMSIQLKEQGLKDGRYRYNADGILRANDFSNLEMMLTEVSSGYGKTENGKVSFDHYKGMFGLLAMLKTFAEKYKEASFETFRKLKVHFVHGHGDAIHHWSMSIQGKGDFVMNKEQRVKVPVEFSNKDIELVPFVNFYATLASAFDETLDVAGALKTEHKDAMRKLSAASLNKEKRNSSSSSSSKEHTNLLNVVDPIIIRLNEGKNTSVVTEHCTSSPDHSY